MSATRSLVVALLLMLMLGGCAPYRAYPGPTRPNREVGWVSNNNVTIVEIDGVSVGGISPKTLHFLPGRHSLVAVAAWESPEGVYPRFHKEVKNRIAFDVWPRRYMALTVEATSTVTVGYSTLVVTGMRILMKEMGREVSTYVP